MPVASEVTPPMSSLGCRAVRAHGPRREVALDAGAADLEMDENGAEVLTLP